MSIDATVPRSLRLVAPPPVNPPYDREPEDIDPLGPLRPALGGVQGALALDLPKPLARPVGTARPRSGPGRPQLRLVDPDEGRRAALSDYARRYLQAVLEVIGGTRPVGQLTRSTDPETVEEIAATARRVARTTTRRGRRPSPPGVIRSLRVAEPAPGVVEVAATIAGPIRTRAVALRLEGSDLPLRCTALRII